MNRRHAALAVLSLIAPLAMPTAHAQAPAASSAPLRLVAESNGTRTTLELRIDGGRVEGSVEEPGLRLLVVGKLDGQRLEARLQEPLTKLTFMFLAGTLQGDRLDATVTPVLSRSQPTHVVFAREGAAAQPSAAVAATPARATAASPAAVSAAIDPRLVGRWHHQSMINSPGGAGGFASFTTQRTFEFFADGRVQQSSRSVGGGGDWSSHSGPKIDFSGRWQVRSGELWLQADAGGAFERVASYRFSGDALVMEGGGGRRIWQR